MKCHLCPHDEPGRPTLEEETEAMVEHIRDHHPEHFEEPERWPDGRVVLEDAEITPENFTG